jgi:hypothetical protein
MGLNAFFTYTLVLTKGVSWEVALGVVFISGIFFLLMTLGGIREKIAAAIPSTIIVASATGIGLFIAFIGLKGMGVIAPNPAKSQITIHSNKPFNSSSKISVFNVNGQIVKKQTDIVDYSDDKLSFNLEVSDLNDGIYFAEIISDTNSKTIKFILKK